MVNLLIFLTPKSETLYLNQNSTVRQTLENFDIHKYSVVPLIDDDGFFVSTISEGDILSFIKKLDYVTCRETSGVELCNKNNIPAKIICDISFP